MIRRGQFLTPADAVVDGVAGKRVDVLELDDESFRAWLVAQLFRVGIVAAQSNDGETPLGDVIELTTQGPQ